MESVQSHNQDTKPYAAMVIKSFTVNFIHYSPADVLSDRYTIE